jgi:stearoyl-CoA desaturase (Delta-9 desaturase)
MALRIHREAPVTEPSTEYDPKLDAIHPTRSLPFLAMHVAVGLVFVTGFRWEWALLALASYVVRMFGVTAGYHRYFSHRAFKTSRVFQFVLAWLAQSSVQKGALWWAAHHRHHHRFSDEPEDIHSPVRKGFWWSHVGWILARRYDVTRYESIKDFARFPELVWLNEYWLVPTVVNFAVLWLLGGLPFLVWGAIVPTVLLWHGTFTINSLSHVFGSRRYLTRDTSRNNWLLALITMGEGWHNNHHYHQNTANQGWFWWEIDLTFYGLKVLSWLRVVSDLRLPRPETKFAFKKYTDEQRGQLKSEAHFGARLPKPKFPTPGPMPALVLAKAPS